MPRSYELLLDMINDPSGPDTKERAEARDWRMSCCRRICRQANTKGAGLQCRKATYWFFMTLNRTLTLLTGQGLEQCLRPLAVEDDELPAGPGPLPTPLTPLPRRTLFVIADQCSVVTCAGTLADHTLGLDIELIHDPRHRFWSSDKNGLTAAGVCHTVVF